MSVALATLPPWSTFHVRWARMGPPQRPDASVVAAFHEHVDRYAERVLLLGVTPELTSIGTQTTAVDWSASALTHIWPGDGPGRTALRANWLNLPWRPASFSAAIGDGSLNCLDYPRGYRRLFDQLATTVRPGGRVGIRVFTRPSRCEPLRVTCARALAGEIGSIHALKWLTAHALCDSGGTSNIAVAAVLDAFNRELPDRQALADGAGWTLDHIGEVDAYRELGDVFSFPTRAEVLSILPRAFANARFVDVGAYELADRCPVLIMERRW